MFDLSLGEYANAVFNSRYLKRQIIHSGFVFSARGGREGGAGEEEVLRISSDGDDGRIFWGFDIFDSGIFLGRKIWQVLFVRDC